MSVEWAFSIDDSEAIGASERLERSLTGLNATASGIDSRLAKVSSAELDAAISASRFAESVNELELSMVGNDTGKLTSRQLELVKSMRMAESEAKQAQAALKALSVDESKVAKGAAKLDAELTGMSQAEMKAAQAASRLSAVHDRYEASLRSAASGTGKLGAEQYELASALSAARHDMVSAQRELDDYNKSMSDVNSTSHWVKDDLGKFGTVAKGAGLAVAAVGAAALAGAGSLAVEVFHAQDFARSTQAAFTAMTGSVDEGARALESIRDIAKATGSPLEEVRQTYGTLRAAGIGDAMSADLSKMRMDWLAMGEEGESAFGKLTDAMVEGVATASMFEDLTKNLAGMGVSSRADFGKALGLSAAALERTQAGADLLDEELKAIDPRKLLEVAVATSKANGELGNVSLQAKSFGERIASFKDFTMGAFVKEMGLSGDSLNELLGEAEKLVESDEFKEFAKDIGAALMYLGEIAVDVAGWIVDNWDTISPILKGIGIAVGVVVGVLAVGAATLGAMFGIVPALGVAALAGFYELYEGIAGVWDDVTAVFGTGFDGIKNMITGFAETMVALGAGVVDGLINGISSRASAAVERVANLGASISSAFKSTLGIASPSKVFREHGGNIVGGLTKQLDSDSPKAGASAMGLAEAVSAGFLPRELAMNIGANDNASGVLCSLQESAAAGMGGVSVPVSYDVGALPSIQAPGIPEPQVAVTAASAQASSSQQQQGSAGSSVHVGNGAIQITVQGAGASAEDIAREVEAVLERLRRQAAA